MKKSKLILPPLERKQAKVWPTILVGVTVIICLLVVVGLVSYLKKSGPVSSAHGVFVSDKDVIFVYYPVGTGKLQRKAVEVQRQLPAKVKADTLFRELKEARCIPDRLRLYEIAQSPDGMLYLNVSKEFLEQATPDRELTITYGIVNSFIESFSDAKSVQLFVENQPVYTSSGLLYLFGPLRFNKELLED